MRTLAVLVLLLALATAAAQPNLTQAYQLRAGLGDISTTSAHEPAGNWSMEQRLMASHSAGTSESATLTIPAGARVLSAHCDCNATTSIRSDSVTFTFSANNPTGKLLVTVATTQTPDTALAGSLSIPTSDSVAILYVPNGFSAEAAKTFTSPGRSTDGQSTIQLYGESGGLAGTFWYAVHPTQSGTAVAAPAAGIPWVWLAGGVVVGAIVWALLVSRGMVQARSRKQVVATAAHVEAAREESAPVLEGRKRALMAALKEIEVAKMNQEMDPAVYDAVKADFKKQAVTVMRALETSGGSK